MSEQCGINICQTCLLLLTSLEQPRIGSCSPSSPSRGVGRPPKKKKKKKKKFLEADLHIITKEGVTIRTSKILISRGSSILRSLLNNAMSPAVLFLPDVTSLALNHLISVLQNGFTNGQGEGYTLIKEVRDVAEVLGFDYLPELTLVTEGLSPPSDVMDILQSVPKGSTENVMDISDGESEEVSIDLSDMDIFIKIEIEDNQSEHEQDELGSSDAYNSMNGENMSEASFISEESHQTAHDQDDYNQDEQSQNEHGENVTRNISASSIESLNLNSARKNGHVLNYAKNIVKITNVEIDVEVYEYKNKEVTETITKVLKKESNEGNDNGHIREVLPKFHCDRCNKTLSNAGTLLVHAEKHEKTKGKRKCPMCSYSAYRIELLRHIRGKHTKEKLFECSICQKKFFTYNVKTIYEKRHKKIQECTCSVCHLILGDSRSAKFNHEMIHTDQSKVILFECSVCLKKFSLSICRDQHERRHTAQSPRPKKKLFECCVCHLKFFSGRSKNEHEKRHTSG